jgi:peptidyl-prolyl cis-trans isomerase SurA
MKKFFVFIALAIQCMAASSQVLITYGGNAITKDEFLKAYNKNKTPVTDKEKSLREYAELYTNFKLKVKAARDMKMDTLPQLNYDIDNFRQQVVENYLNDQKGMDRLMDEAFSRSAKDIRVIHYLIPFPDNTKTEDTLQLSQQAMKVYEEVKGSAGNKTDLTGKYKGLRQSDLGYITAFTVPYEYENIIYSLKPGQVSLPYRNKRGWHIFKSLDERNSVGKWKVSQILFVFPPDANEAVKLGIKHRADSVYNLVKSGADFAQMAEAFSDDRLTSTSKGELPEFGTGKYTIDFEEPVFRLAKDGDITPPFQTPFGYHIVKRLSQVPTVTDKTESGYQFELKQKILQDPRINLEREKFARSILPLVGYKKIAGVSETDLFRYADSMMTPTSTDQALTYPISKKSIIGFKKGDVKAYEWLKYFMDYKTNPAQYRGETTAQVFDKFVNYSALNYYKKHLEEYNPEFKFQMQEFREGNMLFEIMERNVWNKAIVDTVGLLKHYNENKPGYKWAASADVIIFNAATEASAEHALSDLKAGKKWKAIAEEHPDVIQADSGRYELAQLITADKVSNPQPGTVSSIIKNQDGSASFVQYIKLYEPGLQRSFEDARGLVINDYQNVLEKNWLILLKKKYPVKVNETLFRQLVK